MSDNYNKHINKLTDFFRYHRGESTGKERNSFEKELQKDPFVEEAMEGFATLSSEEAESDMGELQRRLNKRTGRRLRRLVFAAAASIALLMALSAMFIFIEKNRSTKQLVSLNTAADRSAEIVVSQPLRKVSSDEAAAFLRTDTTKISAGEKDDGKIKSLPAGNFAKKGQPDAVAVGKSVSLPAVRYKNEKVLAAREQNVAPEKSPDKSKGSTISAGVRGKVLSSEDSLTLEGVPDKNATLSRTPPMPSVGKQMFDKYISENLHRPDSESTQVVVVVVFRVDTAGRLDSVRIVRSPDKAFSDEAVRVIKAGPSWLPAVENGKPVEDSVRLRIVFR